LPAAESPTPKTEPKEKAPVKKDKEEIKPLKIPEKTGRDLTKYKFNGEEYSKGRLAHAIISQYAKEKKPSLKQALALFPAEIIQPYGLIAEVKEARKLSKSRPRFFLKEEEVVKLRDCSICISNQFTTERIAKVIAIARKELKYTIR